MVFGFPQVNTKRTVREFNQFKHMLSTGECIPEHLRRGKKRICRMSPGKQVLEIPGKSGANLRHRLIKEYKLNIFLQEIFDFNRYDMRAQIIILVVSSLLNKSGEPPAKLQF